MSAFQYKGYSRVMIFLIKEKKTCMVGQLSEVLNIYFAKVLSCSFQIQMEMKSFRINFYLALKTIN